MWKRVRIGTEKIHKFKESMHESVKWKLSVIFYNSGPAERKCLKRENSELTVHQCRELLKILTLHTHWEPGMALIFATASPKTTGAALLIRPGILEAIPANSLMKLSSMADVYLCSRSQNECVTIFCTLSFLSPHNLFPWQEDINLSFSQSSSRRCMSAGGYTATHYVNVVNSSFKALPGLNYKNKTAKQWHWCQRRAISSILASQKNTAIIPYCFCISPRTTGLRGVIKAAVKLSSINSNKGSP